MLVCFVLEAVLIAGLLAFARVTLTGVCEVFFFDAVVLFTAVEVFAAGLTVFVLVVLTETFRVFGAEVFAVVGHHQGAPVRFGFVGRPQHHLDRLRVDDVHLRVELETQRSVPDVDQAGRLVP